MNVYRYVCTALYICMYVRMYVRVYVCTYVCMYVRMYVCILYIYIYNFINQHAPIQGAILHARDFMYKCYVLKYIYNIGCVLEYTVPRPVYRVMLLFLLYICMYV